jgi:hypothetical protein
MESAFVNDPSEPGDYIPPGDIQHRRVWPPPPYPAVRNSFSGYIFRDTKAASFEEWLIQQDGITRPPSIHVGPSQHR